MQPSVSQPDSHLNLTEVPYGECEHFGTQRHGDHDRLDRESKSALPGRFNHECPLIAAGDEIAVNYNVGNRIVLPTSGSQEAISCSNQLSSVF